MSPALITALNQQANRELYTSNLLRSLSYWADAEHLGGFAKFFATQAEEEEGHAKKFYQFITDRGSVPTVGPVEAPASSHASLLAVASLLYDHERENTRCINNVYEVALSEKDYATQVFLHVFIAEQVEEESWTDKLLTKVKQSTCGGALFSLDRHISKELLGQD
jgi:ferritin